MSETTTLKQVSVGLARCSGCGACASLAPEIFEMDPETEKPIIKKDEVTEEEVRQAMAYCPEDCIEID